MDSVTIASIDSVHSAKDLTKRQELAARFLAAMLTNPTFAALGSEYANQDIDTFRQKLVGLSVEWADALLVGLAGIPFGQTLKDD